MQNRTSAVTSKFYSTSVVASVFSGLCGTYFTRHMAKINTLDYISYNSRMEDNFSQNKNKKTGNGSCESVLVLLLLLL